MDVGIANPANAFAAMRRQTLVGASAIVVVVLAFYATFDFIVPGLAFAAIPPLLVGAGATPPRGLGRPGPCAAASAVAGLSDDRRRAIDLHDREGRTLFVRREFSSLAYDKLATWKGTP